MTTTDRGSADGAAEDANAASMVDMWDKDLLRDPYGEYSRLRERAPLIRGVLDPIGPSWIVTRYTDVKMVLTDARFVANPANVPGMTTGSALSEEVLREGEVPAEYIKYKMARMGQADGTPHVRLRSPVTQALTARRVADLRPRVEAIAEDLLDRLPTAADDGVVDLLRHFAHPLPATVLCALIGIPEGDHGRWQRWCVEVKRADLTMEELTEAWSSLVTYAKGLIEQRRAKPADDLISAMVHAPGGEHSDTEIISMMLMDHNAHRTVAHLIGNGTVALLVHPGQLALLREDPRLVPGAVEELLRFCGPTTVARLRHATEDVEVGGTTVRKGEALWAILASANHDPRKFDAPARLDITRSAYPEGETHLAFGDGPHVCLGAALTRLVGEVAFGTMLRRLPGLALAVDADQLEREPKPRQWGLVALPVRL